MYRLGEMFIGYNDGKKEASYRDDFELYYFNYNRNIEKILEKDKFLLLGKKGTGKSLLAEYIKKMSLQSHDWFCETSSYKQFNFHELTQLKSRDIMPNEYIAIWEWIILIEVARLCLKDESIDGEYKKSLEEFLTGNFISLKLDMNKVVEITKRGNINGTFLSKLVNFSGQYGKDVKYTHGTYLDYLEDLRNVVLFTLKSSKSKFTILFDELDDKFRNEDIYKSNIISLIKVADRLNTLFNEEKTETKIILLLRTDIFYILNDPDLNKVEQDNSVKLDWGNTVNFHSPLFKMLFTKIRQSIQQVRDIDDETLFNTLFPQKINYRSPDEFILGRTYFRPRDLVTYLNLIIDEYPDTTYFGWKGFVELEKKYSEYLFKEVKNELYGHLSDVEINESFLLLKQFKKTEFTFEEIRDYYSKRKAIYTNIVLEKTLKYLFDFSVLGNTWMHERLHRQFYSWAYRENAEVDYDKKFVVHLGLRKELTL